MIPAFLEMANRDARVLERALSIKIPVEFKDNLIGARIPNSPYYKLLEGDPTKGMCGYSLNDIGKKIYRIEHQPTGSTKRYRKVNSIAYGECWEEICE